jgi:hypothetical protein
MSSRGSMSCHTCRVRQSIASRAALLALSGNRPQLRSVTSSRRHRRILYCALLLCRSQRRRLCDSLWESSRNIRRRAVLMSCHPEFHAQILVAIKSQLAVRRDYKGRPSATHRARGHHPASQGLPIRRRVRPLFNEIVDLTTRE